MDSSSSSSSTTTTASNLRRMGRDRLLRYVADIIRIQTTPLRDVILEHALPFLPAQSLLRLCSVSRSWHRRISSPFFAHTHSHTHRSPSGVFFQVGPQSNAIISYLPFHPRSGSVPDPFLSFIPDLNASLAASSNGLVALYSFMAQLYYICNPATRNWTKIPRRPRRSGTEGGCAGCALVFHPTALNFSADFHLICGVPDTPFLDVFSSKSATWTRSQVRLPATPGKWSSVAVDGVAYWRAKDGSVVSYDPTDDEMSIIEPPEMMIASMRCQLAEVGGKLCCVGGEEGIVEVYELERRCGTWRRRAAIEVDGDPWPLICQGTEDVVVIWMDELVVRIDLRSEESTVVGIEIPKKCVDGVPYVSTLVAVKEFSSS